MRGCAVCDMATTIRHSRRRRHPGFAQHGFQTWAPPP